MIKNESEIPRTVTVRFNGQHTELADSLSKLLGVTPEVSFAYPAMPDKTLRPVTILEFQAKSQNDADRFAELLAPVPGVEVVK